MTNFTTDDVQSLETKLLALELNDGERDALHALVACAEQSAEEVAGFGEPTGLKLGGLGFLLDLNKRPDSLLPDGGVFASAGGLGTTRRVTDEYLGGALGDE